MRSKVIDFFLILFLLALAYIPWQQLPQLVIRGDGFVYMVSQTLDEFFSRTYWYTGFETSAAVLGMILPKLYKTNISLYFYTSLTVMMFINILFYVLLRVIIKHKLISFFGALLFAVNYFGNFDIYSQHCYCFFIERIVSVPFLIPAFIFLHLYLEKAKIKFYFISLAFYLFGVGIAHFAVLFTAPYLIYPFFWYVFKKKKKFLKRDFIKSMALGISYLGISVFFVLIQRIHDSHTLKHSFLEFLLTPHVSQYPQKIVRQLVHWSQYEPIIRSIGVSSLRDSLSIENAAAITPYIVLIYLLASILIYKNLQHMRALLLTSVVGTALIFYINAWFGQYDVLYQPGSNRYLYFPTFLLVLFWTLFVWVFWQSRHIIGKFIVLILVTLYYLLNWLLIYDMFSHVLSWDRSTKVTYNYMTSMRNRLSKDTLVVASYPEVGVYESRFFTETIGNGEVEFASVEDPYKDWKKTATLSAHVIKLTYSRTCDCVREEKIK